VGVRLGLRVGVMVLVTVLLVVGLGLTVGLPVLEAVGVISHRSVGVSITSPISCPPQLVADILTAEVEVLVQEYLTTIQWSIFKPGKIHRGNTLGSCSLG
jgi:hypothetical protein